MAGELRGHPKVDRIRPRVRGIMSRRKLPWVVRTIGLVTAVVALVLLSSLQNVGARQKAEQDADPAAAERGRKQFAQSCGFCHGADATGARGPDLVRSPLVAHDVKGDQIGQVIREGRPDKGMPAMQLSDAQILEIAAFLHARAAEAAHSASVPKGYPIERLLTGSAEAGKAFCNGTGGCNKCHSATGDLAGVAGKYSPIDLEARMLYPAGKHATAVGTLPSCRAVKSGGAEAEDLVLDLQGEAGAYASLRPRLGEM